MMSDDEIIAVVQAHKEGKKIEQRMNPDGQSDNPWCPISHSYEWGYFGTREYRVAPEPRKPREFWMLRIGRAWRLQEHVGDNPQIVSERIKVREVLENESWPDGLGVSVQIPSPRKPREGWIFPSRIYDSPEAVASSDVDSLERAIHVREVIE